MIISLTVWDDIVEVRAKCDKCGNINIHTITHACTYTKKSTGQIVHIDLLSLGSRMCHGQKCFNHYKLHDTPYTDQIDVFHH